MVQLQHATDFGNNSKVEDWENIKCFVFAALFPPNDLFVGLQDRKNTVGE